MRLRPVHRADPVPGRLPTLQKGMFMHIFTSVTANYLPKAAALAHSVKRVHPEATFHVVLSDELPECPPITTAAFDSIINVRDLPIDQAPRLDLPPSAGRALHGRQGNGIRIHRRPLRRRADLLFRPRHHRVQPLRRPLACPGSSTRFS